MSQFTLSCATCSARWPGADEITEWFKIAPSTGFKYWALAGPTVWTPYVARWLNTDLVNRLASEAGLLGCTEVYAPKFPTDSIQVAEKAAAYMALMWGTAEKLGCPLVVFTGGKRQEGGLQATIAGIRALLPMIAGSPVRMALEPHYHSQIENRADYDEIFAQIDNPQVGITADVGHLHAAGVDWKALIRDYRNRIYNVHVKDHIGAQSVALGKGEIDLRGLIEVLHMIDYQGALAVELEVVDFENLPRYCADAYVYLRQMILDITGQAPD